MAVTAVLDRVEPESLSTRARQISFSGFLVRVIAAFFFLIGWTLSSVWFAIVWSALAIGDGFQAGKGAGLVRARRE